MIWTVKAKKVAFLTYDIEEPFNGETLKRSFKRVIQQRASSRGRKFIRGSRARFSWRD